MLLPEGNHEMCLQALCNLATGFTPVKVLFRLSCLYELLIPCYWVSLLPWINPRTQYSHLPVWRNDSSVFMRDSSSTGQGSSPRWFSQNDSVFPSLSRNQNSTDVYIFHKLLYLWWQTNLTTGSMWWLFCLGTGNWCFRGTGVRNKLWSSTSQHEWCSLTRVMWHDIWPCFLN